MVIFIIRVKLIVLTFDIQMSLFNSNLKGNSFVRITEGFELRKRNKSFTFTVTLNLFSNCGDNSKHRDSN